MPLTRRLDALVGHQLERWQAAGRRTQTQPSIAIASLLGAGGEEIGRLVADRLGYGLFGRDIVDEIARRRGVGETLMQGLDERVRDRMHRYVADAFRSRVFNENDYLGEVVRAVTTLGRRGLAVIVGRGSAFILDPQSTLRVFLAAPVPVRVERIAKQRGLDRAQAEAFLREEDARRTHFIRRHFGARLDDPLAYDVTLNTGLITPAAGADLVAESLRARFPGAA